MRESKYKAINKINGLFAFGQYYMECGIHRIHSGHTVYPIEYKTLCQFTGLKDKVKNEIYLNDLHKDKDNKLWKVCELECGRFALQNVYSLYIDEFVDWNRIEIIGNIHQKS